METTQTTEVIGIEFTGTCDLAMWCKLLRDKGWTGPRIARYLGRSEGYVNNLIRVVERASPAVLVRWREEQAGALVPVCATDWLVQICLRSHEEQDLELARRIQAVGVGQAEQARRREAEQGPPARFAGGIMALVKPERAAA